MTFDPEQLTIRRAVAADAPVVAELALRTFMETFAADNNSDDVAVYTAKSYGVPITYIGLGEKMEDLRPFDGQDFAQALLGVGGD